MSAKGNKRQQPEFPLRFPSGEELANYRVSSKSIWRDNTWIFDSNKVRSDSEVSIKWSITLNNGDSLTDAKYHRLLDWLKKMVWSLIVAPGDGYRPLSPGTMPSVGIGMAKLVPWMVENHILWPHQLSQDVLDQLYEDLTETTAGTQQWQEDHDDDARKSLGSAGLTLNFIYYIWRQRKALKKAGIAPMPSKPWPHEEGANTLVVRIAGRTRGWTPPLPDEIAIPLLNAASSFLGVPARDIQDILTKIQAVETEVGSSAIGQWANCDNIRSKRVKDLCQAYRFTVMAGCSEAWHAPLYQIETDRPTLECRRLLHDLVAACCIVICGSSGLRGNELEELNAGLDEVTGLPAGVSVKKSATGLNEEFILLSGMSKGSPHPAMEEWLLGSRRVGDVEEPQAVLAIRILNALLEPYRRRAGSSRLVLTLTTKSPYVGTALATELNSASLKRLFVGFIERHVDLTSLPDTSRFSLSQNDLIVWRESKGSIIRPGALRKTFASYVLSTSPELLPAVKRQFQHMNMSMTEGGYWGTNLKQVEPISSVSRQMTARMLYDLTQDGPLGGKMGRQIAENIEPLKAIVRGLSPGKGWRRVLQWVEDNELHVNHGSHGDCVPIAASRMDCWSHSEKRPVGALLPNFEARNVSMCAGCSCFLMSERHVPFWEDRLRAHEDALRSAEQLGVRTSSFRELGRRALQAKNVLRSLRSREQERGQTTRKE